jgi:ribosomal protein L33
MKLELWQFTKFCVRLLKQSVLTSKMAYGVVGRRFWRMKNPKTIQKVLRCTVCGMVMSIWRKQSKNKASGHVKHMYCPKCNETTEHIELEDD